MRVWSSAAQPVDDRNDQGAIGGEVERAGLDRFQQHLAGVNNGEIAGGERLVYIDVSSLERGQDTALMSLRGDYEDRLGKGQRRGEERSHIRKQGIC